MIHWIKRLAKVEITYLNPLTLIQSPSDFTQDVQPRWPRQSMKSPARYWDILTRVNFSITVDRMLLRLTTLKFSMKETLCIAATAAPLQSFGISPCSRPAWNSLHTGPAVMPANGLMMAGWISSVSADLFLFNPSSCLRRSSSVISKSPINCDEVSSTKAPGSHLSTLWTEPVCLLCSGRS